MGRRRALDDAAPRRRRSACSVSPAPTFRWTIGASAAASHGADGPASTSCATTPSPSFAPAPTAPGAWASSVASERTAAGSRRTGRVFRLPAIGPVSGDWGGGGDLGSGRALARHPGGRRARGPNRAPTQRPRVLRHANRPAGDGGDVLRSDSPTSASPSSRRSSSRRPPRATRSRPSSSASRPTRSRSWRPPRSASSGCATLDLDVVLGGGIFRNEWSPFLERITLGLARGGAGRANRPA